MADLNPQAGATVHLGDIVANTKIYGVVGEPGPSGEVTCTFTVPVGPQPAGPPVPPVATLYAGTRHVPEWCHKFTIDGWEYSFASKEIARKVRDELMRLTLEGEL